VKDIVAGLRRWTSWHEDWEEEVGSVAVETDDGLVLIDPNDPPAELARAAHVLLTVYWHARATKRVGAPRVWAASRSAQPLRNRGIDVTDVLGRDAVLPAGIRALQTARAAEVAYWLPQQRAVVVGDVLLGAGAKPRATAEPLRLCPQGWLGKASHDDLRESLRPLLDLPVEHVLMSHGAPVLGGGARELKRVLSPS